MNSIPLLYFQKRKIYSDKENKEISMKELFDLVDKDKEIYVYDTDGIVRNKPNLCSYPKLSEQYRTWVDYGPRTLGDVVDAVMAGASNIVLRKNLWPKVEISRIKDITEKAIYEIYEIQQNTNRLSFFSLSPESEGFVIFSNKTNTKRDFIYDDAIKNICKKFNVFVIEPNDVYFSYWKNVGASGLIVELNKWKEAMHK